jgi:hypothetical protein
MCVDDLARKRLAPREAGLRDYSHRVPTCTPLPFQVPRGAVGHCRRVARDAAHPAASARWRPNIRHSTHRRSQRAEEEVIARDVRRSIC